MAEQRLTVPAGGGRTLEVLDFGPDTGLPLVFHDGTPGGLVAYGPMADVVAGLGLRLILYARPGYGASDPQPGRVIADAAADVTAILDQLGAGPFVTAGWSGGGPHALACAALLPGRCLAAATMAGVAPFDSPGLDWLAGMGPENIEEFRAALEGEAATSAFLSGAAGELREISGGQVVDGMGGLLSDVDKAVLSGDFGEFLAASMRAALSSGIAGWRDDDLAFVRDWGFEVTGLAGSPVPVAVWQGAQDLMVPPAHGVWLAGQLPAARTHLLPDDGHLTLAATVFGDIIAELLELAGVRHS
ncbi:MAG: alpha/beta fold hydrolase [Actinomycetota bacterium]